MRSKRISQSFYVALALRWVAGIAPVGHLRDGLIKVG